MLKERTWLEIFGRDRDRDRDGDGDGSRIFGRYGIRNIISKYLRPNFREKETIFTFALWSEPRC